VSPSFEGGSTILRKETTVSSLSAKFFTPQTQALEELVTVDAFTSFELSQSTGDLLVDLLRCILL